MLHVTNGDSVQLREAGVGGEVLVWLDALHEGPVPEGLPLERLSDLRGEYLDRMWSLAPGTVAAALAARDRAIGRFADHEEVVLWFEHDLYDQLQLIQILDYFTGRESRLSLVQSSDYLGYMSPEALRAMWPERSPVTPAQIDLAVKAWQAFRSPDPTHLEPFAKERSDELPFLAAALLRHLEQFPSVRNGLARTEAQILEGLAHGPLDFAGLFAADQAREDALFMGDTTFLWWLSRLETCSHPLVERRGEVWAITAAGRDVLAGRADQVGLNGIDRRLGGVHLQGREAGWRWDSAAQKLRENNRAAQFRGARS